MRTHEVGPCECGTTIIQTTKTKNRSGLSEEEWTRPYCPNMSCDRKKTEREVAWLREQGYVGEWCDSPRGQFWTLP